MNDRTSTVTQYEINGYGLRMYCKVTEYGINTEAYKSTISFGTGIKKFCLIAAYFKQKPNEIYIDRVEKKDVCTIGKPLGSFEEGTVKLVKVALWTMKNMYPAVVKFTLRDDSQIMCDGENSKDKMSMSYDYILKYNETWYQNKFNAELPGFISKTRNKNSKLTIVNSEENSLMANVYNSFKVLDEPITPLPLVIDLLPMLNTYKEEYESSTTPRQFIDKLRTKLENKYCNTVGKWLNSYMLYLHIDIEMNKWYILEKYIKKPESYSISLAPQNVFLGGSNTRKTIKKNTIKKKTKIYEMVSDCYFTKNGVGNYDE
jgi:hypothetical protein